MTGDQHQAPADDLGLADYRALAAGLAAAQADSATARAQRGTPGGADGWREVAGALRDRFSPPAGGEGEA